MYGFGCEACRGGDLSLVFNLDAKEICLPMGSTGHLTSGSFLQPLIFLCLANTDWVMIISANSVFQVLLNAANANCF